MDTTQIKFDLIFKNKAVDIVFDAESKKRTHVIDQGWKSIPFANAIGTHINLAAPRFQVMENGLYLHQPLTEIMESLGNDNAGYVMSTRLEELLKEGTLSYRKDVEPGQVYRVRWDGFVAFPSLLTADEYTKDEPDWVRHNRKAIALIRALETMRKAEDLGVNIRLLYTDDEAKRFDLLKLQWGMFKAGKFDELAENIKAGEQKASTYNTLKHYERVAERAKENGAPLTAPEGYKVITTDGQALDPQELIGLTIKLYAGKNALPFEFSVTAESLGQVTRSIKAAPGITVGILKDETSVAPKARKNNRKPEMAAA